MRPGVKIVPYYRAYTKLSWCAIGLGPATPMNQENKRKLWSMFNWANQSSKAFVDTAFKEDMYRL